MLLMSIQQLAMNNKKAEHNEMHPVNNDFQMATNDRKKLF